MLEVSIEKFLKLLVIAEILKILVKLLREGVDLDALDDLNEEAIRQFSDGADELTAESRVILQREFEELNLGLNLFLSFEEALQLRKVSLGWQFSDEELLVLVEGDFEVFVDGVE